MLVVNKVEVIMNVKSLKRITAQLETQKRHLAKDRDALREIESEIQMYAESADSALQDLECCIETLSQYV